MYIIFNNKKKAWSKTMHLRKEIKSLNTIS
jgi:hypothetical protein